MSDAAAYLLPSTPTTWISSEPNQVTPLRIDDVLAVGGDSQNSQR
jgi:hypothetical protein